MKRIFATIAILAVAASSAFAQISVGAGYVSNTYKVTSTILNDNIKTNGFYAGGDYNFNLYKGLGVAPGLYFQYGSKSNTIGSVISGTVKEANLAIPVNFNYAIPVVDGLRIVPYLGPTFALGLSCTGTINGKTSSNFYDNANFKFGRFDFLLGGGVALDIVDMIRVSFGYNFGLINRSSASGMTAKTRDFHCGVAYLF